MPACRGATVHVFPWTIHTPLAVHTTDRTHYWPYTLAYHWPYYPFRRRLREAGLESS